MGQNRGTDLLFLASLGLRDVKERPGPSVNESQPLRTENDALSAVLFCNRLCRTLAFSHDSIWTSSSGQVAS